MIATVRIAPVERWCNPEDLTPEAVQTVGLEIEILTETMVKSECGGNSWRTSDASHDCLHFISGCQCSCPAMWICEHMLEMD